MTFRSLLGLAMFGMLGLSSGLQAATVTTAVTDYFDPPADPEGYSNAYRVAGSLTPSVSWSWGRIEALEGLEKYRTEGYNLRTQRLRYQDTWQTADYPMRDYWGELNQEVIDGFNLYYKNGCAAKTSSATCPDPGPTRPQARLVLLHVGPYTAKAQCDKSRTPVLLIHGATQNANVWLYPNGYDGKGHSYLNTPVVTGMTQALEDEGLCTFAVTFGNHHGDNFSQATNLHNAIQRVKAITGSPKVNLVTWSKGSIPVDTYLANVASWKDWDTTYFGQIASIQASAVPAYDGSVGVYAPLSGPHRGIDLNFRHPYDDLFIPSVSENVGQGPMAWGKFMAFQCVTWGYYSSPDAPWWMANPYAYSICENRGATWPDFWKWIYVSNIKGLDTEGRPTYDSSLKRLNSMQGANTTNFDFDQYNIAMWGSVTDQGKFVSAYLGQIQAAYDFRTEDPFVGTSPDLYPILSRLHDGYDWTGLDTDEYNWYQWIIPKVEYDPVNLVMDAGYLHDADHTICRESGFDPKANPCLVSHEYINRRNAVSVKNNYATYQLFDGLGIKTTMAMGGNFMQHLRKHGISPNLDFLYVIHGTALGPVGFNYEIDGMECPTCEVNGDAVLFEASVAGLDQLTQGWSPSVKLAKATQTGVAISHLEVGYNENIFGMLLDKFAQIDAAN